MTLNKKTAVLFSTIGLAVGSIVAIGLQAHAQSTPSPVASVSVSTPSPTPADTDNIQDPNGIEKVDATDVKEGNETSTVDTQQEQGKDAPENQADKAD